MAIAFRQAKSEHNVSLTTHKTTFTSSVNAGSVIGIAIMTQALGSAAPTSVVDDNGDTVIPITGSSFTSGWCNPASGEGSMGIYLFYCPAGGSIGITPTFASSTTWSAIVFEYTGVNTTTPLDGNASAVFNGSNTSNPTTAGSSLTPTQVGDQQMAFLASGNTNSHSSWGNSLDQESSQTALNAAAYFADL